MFHENSSMNEIEAVLELDNWKQFDDILCKESNFIFQRKIEYLEDMENVEIIKRRCLRYIDIYMKENQYKYSFFVLNNEICVLQIWKEY